MPIPTDFSSLTPLAGGWSGETFLGRAGDEQVVVRVYADRATRGPVAAQVDAALLRLVRGLVPVPEVLDVHPSTADGDRPGILVTSLMDGVRGDELLPALDRADLARVGAAFGEVAGVLAGMPMLTAGRFVDARLAIGSFGVDGLPGYVEAREPELGHLTPEELTGLRQVALDAQTLLDTVDRHCLVHGDLNPKNLLIDPASLTVTAVVDWEFAHAGHPYTDLGNLVRFDRKPAYLDAVLGRYAERHGVELDAALALARAADLTALVDLACRRSRSPVATRAEALLRSIARRRDPGAAEPA